MIVFDGTALRFRRKRESCSRSYLEPELRRTARRIPDAAPDSLEKTALSDPETDVAYVGPSWLLAQPPRIGSAFDDHQPVTANWGQVYDGIVVFKTERPPHRIDE